MATGWQIEHSISGKLQMANTCKIGRKLHSDNSGAMRSGVTSTGRFTSLHGPRRGEFCNRPAYFVLNIKDHIRGGKRQHRHRLAYRGT